MTREELKQELKTLELSYLINIPEQYREVVENFIDDKCEKLATIINNFVLSKKVQSNIPVTVAGPGGTSTGNTTSQGNLID